MKERYLLAEDTIDQKDLEGLIAWLQEGPWLTQGKLVQDFEARWAKWVGTKHSVFVNSGSSANLLMYATLLYSGKLKNKKVIVPAIAWATTIAPAIQLGFEPIMCDADADTYGMDPVKLEALLKEHDPGAVIVVHVLGVPAKMNELKALQEQYGFLLMEDACAAMGSRYDGKRVGCFGDTASFSCFFGHHMSTIEGGLVCTDDTDLYHTMLMVRSHGWSKDLPAEAEEKLATKYNVDGFNRPFTFYIPGFNLRSSDLNAKLGLSQLAKLDQVVSRRAENHKVYQQFFEGTDLFQCQHNPEANIASIAFALMANDSEHRARIAERLGERKIDTRPLGGGSMARQPFWADRYGVTEFEVADTIGARVMQLPNHPAHSVEDIQFICETVAGA